MKILVACEESQAVTIAFRELGHDAYSCDILQCSGGHPEWHFQLDVRQVLAGGNLATQLGPLYTQKIEKWDMIIAFPPCTYMSNAGACRMYPVAGVIDLIRFEKAKQAKEFFMLFYDAKCDKIAIENPIPLKVVGLPDASQTIQPYEFGHPYSKRTKLWLKGLPLLKPTDIITENIVSFVSGGSKDHNGNPRTRPCTKFRKSIDRSKTFPGIANAMADQWGKYILTNI